MSDEVILRANLLLSFTKFIKYSASNIDIFYHYQRKTTYNVQVKLSDPQVGSYVKHW